MISGRESIEHLLRDLNELAKESEQCNIVLLARTETLQNYKTIFNNNNGVKFISLRN